MVTSSGTDSGRGTKVNNHAAVVYNPIKVDVKKLRRSVSSAEEEYGWGLTRWYETSKSDAGQSITRKALGDGADVVLVAGGDGTVRAVAEALRDSSVPLALLPSGTGNIFARNLDLNLSDMDSSVGAAFGGNERAIDLGIATITRPDGATEEHVFLVMAGIGLDAKMIALTNPRLKKAVGWLAYVDAGMRALPELKPVRLRYRLDDRPEKQLNAHTLMVGNCGTLPGGILLLPEAKPDDGILDIAALKPRGRFGWLRVWNKIAWENGVLRKSTAGRKIIDLTVDVRDVLYFRGERIQATLQSPQEFQLDGDEFGTVTAIDCTTDAGALVVKVPS